MAAHTSPSWSHPASGGRNRCPHPPPSCPHPPHRAGTPDPVIVEPPPPQTPAQHGN